MHRLGGGGPLSPGRAVSRPHTANGQPLAPHGKHGDSAVRTQDRGRHHREKRAETAILEIRELPGRDSSLFHPSLTFLFLSLSLTPKTPVTMFLLSSGFLGLLCSVFFILVSLQSLGWTISG